MADSRQQENHSSAAASPVAGNSAAQRDRLPLPLVIAAFLAVAGLLAFAGVVVYELLIPKEPIEIATATANDASKPVSITAGEGVTVIEKQPESVRSGQNAHLAPVARGAQIASGYAMDLGSAQSFFELSRRFASIAETNGPDNFMRLEPRATLKETMAGLEARLLVGPFESKRDAAEACDVLVLDEATACLPVPFEGELISRQ